MSFKLSRKFKKYNKLVNKYIFSDVQSAFPNIDWSTDFSIDSRDSEVQWFIYDDVTGMSPVGGYYKFNKQKKVTSYALIYKDAFGNLSESYAFDLGRRSKDFKIHLKHRQLLFNHDPQLRRIVQDGINERSCETFAHYIDQIPGGKHVNSWNRGNMFDTSTFVDIPLMNPTGQGCLA